MVDILLNILTHCIYFFGLIFLIGWLISVINRQFYRLVNYNRAVCLSTGLIGTPIHELGHAFFCVVFGHKIVDMKLFQKDDENGVLGYVSHTYNPKNLWQKIGNYFIGIAPILCGSAVILLGLSLLLPSAFNATTAALNTFAETNTNVLSWDWFEGYFSVFGTMISSIFEVGFGWELVVFLVLAMCIALHMNLSGADIKNALPSIPFLLLVIVAVNMLFGFLITGIYNDFLQAMAFGGTYVAGVLLLSIVLSLAYLIVGLVIKGIVSIFHR